MELISNINPLEFIAVITGILSVWLAKKENVWLYPIGIISVVLWIYLCWIGKLFGQSLINFFFLVMNVYGWYNWLRRDENNQPNVVIKSSTKNQNILLVIFTIVLSVVVFYLLLPIQEDNALIEFILIEAVVTALNFVAMWLMAWKRIEHWLLWIVGDFMCIPLFIHKDYPLGVVQFLVFIVIAYLGYKEWKLKAVKQ
jgi:nicotinamide mononucleotide transporter